jgi:DNA-binding MarR family transcriptional regulator
MLKVIDRPMIKHPLVPPAASPSAGAVRRIAERLVDTYPDMTMTQFRIFAYIAENPGITQRELIEHLGVTDTTGSRTVQLLGSDGTRGKPGLRLVDVRPDPSDRRQRLLSLTDKGRRLMGDIEEEMKTGR